MKCEQARPLLDAWLDGELSAQDHATLQAHLADCANCRADSEALRRQDEHLREALAANRRRAAAVAERVIATLPDERVTPASLDSTRSSWFRRRNIQRGLAAAIVVLFAVLAFWPNGRLPQPPPTLARLTLASGDVLVRPPGQGDWETAPLDFTVMAGCQVRTGPQVQCELVTPEGAVVRVNERTELQFHSEQKIQVVQGQLWCCPTTEKSLEVAAPGVQVATRGGKFDLKRQGDETVVTSGGRTDVRTAEGHRQLEPGQAIKITAGKLPERPHSSDLLQVTRWITGLLILKGRDDPELSQRVDELLAGVGKVKMSFLHEEEIRSLGQYSVLPLTRYVQSERSRKDPAKRVRAMALLADLAQPWSIPDLIAILEDTDKDVRFHAARALQRLTGHDQGCPPAKWRSPWQACEPAHKQWKNWWQGHKQQYPGVVPPRGK